MKGIVSETQSTTQSFRRRLSLRVFLRRIGFSSLILYLRPEYIGHFHWFHDSSSGREAELQPMRHYLEQHGAEVLQVG
jgi:hypothetical protein